MINIQLTEQQAYALAGLLDAALRQIGLRAVDDVKVIKDILEEAVTNYKKLEGQRETLSKVSDAVKASLGRIEESGEIKNVDAPV